MKNLLKGIWLFLVIVITGCFDKDVFPDKPKISFEDLVYVDVPSDEGPDSLILTFSFEDGGGDVGLGDGADLFTPYQIYDVIIDSDDSTITISQDGSSINPPLFKAPVVVEGEDGEEAYYFFPENKVPFSSTDNRPLYSCDDYEIIESDTFYISRNEFYYNFHIEFQRKTNNSYSKIDFKEVFNEDECDFGNFNSRIPFFDPEGKSGNITYAIVSRGFKGAFLDDEVRLRFYIYDRALNKSNVVTSPSFILADIIQ